MNETKVNELVSQCKAGSAEALEKLLRWVVSLVHKTLFGMARNHDLAEELTQEVAEVVVTRLASYKSGTRFRQWVLTIAANRFKDHLRRKKLLREPCEKLDHIAAKNESPSLATERMARQQELWQAISQLKTEERTIFCLRHVGELSFKEIAKTLGKPLGTVLSTQHRAMTQLAKKLKNDR